jgi:hypothetical protein
MSSYTVNPTPYKVSFNGKINWVPQVHMYIQEGNKTIDRVITWEKDISFDTEGEAKNFINRVMEKLERIKIQLRGEQVAALKAIAEEHGTSLAKVLRQAMDKIQQKDEVFYKVSSKFLPIS